MGTGTALAIAGIITCGILALNIIYGFCLSLNGSDTTPSTRAQRWFVTLLGLQYALILLLGEYMKRGQKQTGEVILATLASAVLWAFMSGLLLMRFGEGVYLLANFLLLSYVLSGAIAIKLQPKVFASSR